MKMLKIAVPIAMLAAGMALNARADRGVSLDQLERTNQAVQDAVAKAQKAFASAPVPAKAGVVVLPLYNDEAEDFRDRMKIAVTACGKTCVEDKNSPVLDEILQEITWDERKQDVLDPATVVSFGRLKGAEYLLYGGVANRFVVDRYSLVELELHLTEVATKKHVWGGTFVGRVYSDDQTNGCVDIPADVRKMLRTKLKTAIAGSLANSAKLKNIHSVAILPLSADADGYLGGLVRDVVTSSALTPVELEVRTRSEARYAMKDGSVKCDAICYGTVRDFSANVKALSPTQSDTRTAHVEVQLWIEDGATHEILWSDTLADSVDFSVGPDGWWPALCRMFPVFQEKPWLAVVLPLGIILGLIVLIVVVKNATRVR